jgi:hypothetical protein
MYQKRPNKVDKRIKKGLQDTNSATTMAEENGEERTAILKTA